MEISSLGQNLIFIISQPRAGSTLLQRMLGSHPEIHTTSEPWLMLQPLYALRKEGMVTEYNHYFYWLGLQEFLKSASPDDPEALYYEGIRRMYSHLYNHALAPTGKKLFLDKTPRYYLIVPELKHTFPHAKFIVILRNPLAVLSSMIRSWSDGDWFWFSHIGRQPDLLSAPRLLMQGAKALGSSCITIHYEKLVASPEDTISKVMKFLNITYLPQIIAYGEQNLPKWRFGDQDNVYEHKMPISENAEEWSRHLDGPQTWRMLYEYLNFIGKDLFEELGYSFDESHNILMESKPKKQLQLTIPLSFLLKPETERVFTERALVKLLKRSKLLSKH